MVIAIASGGGFMGHGHRDCCHWWFIVHGDIDCWR